MPSDDRILITTPEGVLHVETAGTRGSAVILLSGAGIDNARLSWKRLMPVLAESYRVFALDWPKQGRSFPWHGVADHACLVRCVLKLMDHAQLDRAAFVGLSQGGAVALSLAIDHPEKVTRTVAIAPAGIIRFAPVLHQMLWAAAKMPWLTSGLSRFMLSSRKGIERLVRSGLFAGPSPDFADVVDGIRDEIAKNGVRASDWQNSSIGFSRMNIDLLPKLSRVQRPILFLQGDKDIAVRPHFTEEAAKRTPNAKYVLLENHGHWPNRQSPDLIAGLVTDFLAEEQGEPSSAQERLKGR